MCNTRFMLYCDCSGVGCHIHINKHISYLRTDSYGNFAKVSWNFALLQSQLILTA